MWEELKAARSPFLIRLMQCDAMNKKNVVGVSHTNQVEKEEGKMKKMKILKGLH